MVPLFSGFLNRSTEEIPSIPLNGWLFSKLLLSLALPTALPRLGLIHFILVFGLGSRLGLFCSPGLQAGGLSFSPPYKAILMPPHVELTARFFTLRIGLGWRQAFDALPARKMKQLLLQERHTTSPGLGWHQAFDVLPTRKMK